ncbi:hypothetical protein CMT41_16460 [Colwellia sp. MT41]|uniref:hypothetical protein n=1 Tax=Colwellia sp. MT41 TaxID=58049 RepID=UPI00071778A7|nr:hypothetical protein [Colwellia sp. MT41]ALO36145.1 hypothetical protein CMT41_16460 [Colwellia sp. MT41]
MKEYTKEDSVKIINHIISAYKAKGWNQSKISQYYDLEPSRVSEAKNGNYKIDNEILAKMEADFGFPSRSSGWYTSASYYSTTEDFIKSYSDIVIKQYGIKLYKALKHKSTQESFSSKFEIICDNLKLQRNKKQTFILEVLTKFINSKEGAELHTQSINSNVMQLKQLCDALTEFGITPNSKGIANKSEHIVYRLLSLRYDLLPEVEFGFLNETELLSVSKSLTSEFVISGTEIFSEIFQPNSRSTFEQVDRLIKYYHRNPLTLSQSDFTASSCIEFKVFLSKTLKYTLVISFCNSNNIANFDVENDHRVLIENIDMTSLVSEFQLIQEHLNLPTVSDVSLKQKIALSGGYIPGARVID